MATVLSRIGRGNKLKVLQPCSSRFFGARGPSLTSGAININGARDQDGFRVTHQSRESSFYIELYNGAKRIKLDWAWRLSDSHVTRFPEIREPTRGQCPPDYVDENSQWDKTSGIRRPPWILPGKQMFI